jgi:hypothetical protein
MMAVSLVIWIYFSLGVVVLLRKRVPGYMLLMVVIVSFFLTMIVTESSK